MTKQFLTSMNSLTEFKNYLGETFKFDDKINLLYGNVLEFKET